MVALARAASLALCDGAKPARLAGLAPSCGARCFRRQGHLQFRQFLLLFLPLLLFDSPDLKVKSMRGGTWPRFG